MQGLRNQIMQALDSAGLSYLSTHSCCQLLAFTYVCGGGCEYTVVNKRLNSDIAYAQKRAKIIGGDIPDPYMVKVMNEYIIELQTANEPPLWAYELCEKYKIPDVFLKNKQFTY